MLPDLAQRIIGFLRDELAVDDRPLDRDTPLVTSGLVDSVGLVRLATFLERETGVRIPDRDVHAEHFDTLARIEAYLKGRVRS